jgi:hypothetical protein
MTLLIELFGLRLAGCSFLRYLTSFFRRCENVYTLSLTCNLAYQGQFSELAEHECATIAAGLSNFDIQKF